MSCAEFEILIALQVEDDLPEGQEPVVSGHLKSCSACREFAGELRQSQAALKSLRYEPIGTEVFAEVRERVLASVPARRARDMAWAKYAVAAAVFVALGATVLWRSRHPITPQQPVAPEVTVTAPAPIEIPVVRVQPRRKMLHRKLMARRVKTEMEPFRAVASTVAKSEPLVIKLLTDDPQVVIYWLVDQNGG